MFLIPAHCHRYCAKSATLDINDIDRDEEDTCKIRIRSENNIPIIKSQSVGGIRLIKLTEEETEALEKFYYDCLENIIQES